jgi:hypothetical protein
VYASVGGPTDSLRALEPRVISELRSTAAANRQTSLLSPLLAQAAGVSFPVYRFNSIPDMVGRGNTIVDIVDLLARGDTAGTRRKLAAFGTIRSTRRPADLTLDYTYPAAWTLATLGDRAAATQWLDPVLNSATLFPPQSLSRIANAGALMRSLILRAQLAEQAGDVATARRWARPVTILWRDADPFLHPAVAEMQRLSAAPGRPGPARH